MKPVLGPLIPLSAISSQDSCLPTGPLGHAWYKVLDQATARRFVPGTYSFVAFKVSFFFRHMLLLLCSRPAALIYSGWIR